MPPGVQYRELAHLIDFIYNGNVKIPSDDLNSFLALAEQFKIKGLTEDKGKILANKMATTPKPQQPKTLPKLPSGIQMVKRGAQSVPVVGGPSPQPTPKGVKRNHQEEPEGQQYKAFIDNDGSRVISENVEDDGDNDPELGDGIPDDSGDYFDEYEEEGDFGDYDYDENGAPMPPHQSSAQPHSASAGLQLTGLLCPTCRVVCKGVDALKDHISQVHGMHGHQPSPQQHPPKVVRDKGDVPTNCEICDKSFKSFRYMVAHKKRIHNIDPVRKKPADPFKKKGRPSKKELLSVEDLGVEEAAGFEPQPTMPVASNKQGMGLQPSMSRQNLPKESKGRPEMVSATSMQRPPNMAGRSAMPQEQQFMMSEGISVASPSRRMTPSNRLPPGVGTIMSRPNQNPAHPIDIKSLGHKLGGQISIISSEPASSQVRRGPQIPLSQQGAAEIPHSSKDQPRLLNRGMPPKQSHMKESPVEELEVIDDDDDLEGDEDYDEANFGDDCEDDSADYDHDGMGHPGMDMSDSVDGMYEESNFEHEDN